MKSDLVFCRQSLKKAIRRALKADKPVLPLLRELRQLVNEPEMAILERVEAEINDLKNEVSFLKARRGFGEEELSVPQLGQL